MGNSRCNRKHAFTKWREVFASAIIRITRGSPLHAVSRFQQDRRLRSPELILQDIPANRNDRPFSRCFWPPDIRPTIPTPPPDVPERKLPGRRRNHGSQFLETPPPKPSLSGRCCSRLRPPCACVLPVARAARHLFYRADRIEQPLPCLD